MNFPGINRKKGPPSAEPTPTPAPTPTLTSAEWKERIADVERQIAETQQALAEKREQRRSEAGATIIFGSNGDSLARAEEAEREIERRIDSLAAALEFGRGELQKTEAAEEAARREEQKRRCDAISLKILEHAARVDQCFATAANDLRSIEELYRSYLSAGGGFQMRLKINASRAARGYGLRDFIVADFVGYNVHSLPLATQLASLSGARPPESLVDDEVPAKTA